MADNSSGPVAIVAIIAILLLLGAGAYFMTGGTFNFSKTTVVQPTKVVAVPTTKP